MGRYGTGRWPTKKIAVEECLNLPIKLINLNLLPGCWRKITWSVGEHRTADVSYCVEGDEHINAVRLIYYHTSHASAERTDFDYRVPLTTTPLPWGGVRYWFVCPLSRDSISCGRRVGVIYLPPGYQYFGCRHCYELTYRSCQVSHKLNGFYKRMQAIMWNEIPELPGGDLRYLLENGGLETPIPDDYLNRRSEALKLKYLEDLASYDPYGDYLTRESLLEQSGLSSDVLDRLEHARLLLPDTSDGRFRPKLAGWGRKMAQLLAAGWEVSEIKRWANGRWTTQNPREFPPNQKDWRKP